MDVAFNLPEDFAADESFVNYCFQNDESDILFWEEYLKKHPEKKPAAEKGRRLVLLMSISVGAEEKHEAFAELGISSSKEDKHPSEVYPRPSRRRLRPYLATGTLVLLAAGFFWKVSSTKRLEADEKPLKLTKDYVSLQGQRRQIILNDGTTIVLNALSRLAVKPGFGKSNREVSLKGEAFFKVADDAAKPFIIHTDNMDITVLGTTLNVRDYPGDLKAEAALLSGSVAIALHTDSSQKIILKPDEKIITYKYPTDLTPLNTRKSLQIKTSHAEKGFAVAPLVRDPLLDSGAIATAWMENKLVFRDESFEELAEQLARKYDVQFHFSNQALTQYRFTGVFSKETIEEALRALQLTSPSDPFDFSVEGRDIYIRKK